MQRDKRGRFVKKALLGSELTKGTVITLNGKKFQIMDGASDAYTSAAGEIPGISVDEWLKGAGSAYLKAYEETKETKGSFGRNTFFDTESSNNTINPINKTKLADFIEFTRAGISTAVNNKIADRALEAEKPFLQEVSESHRSVYGDYRSKIQGEKKAAELRQIASRPLTSDGSQQQDLMLKAQIQGNKEIDQNNAVDEALIRQTNEVAWQQEKENQQQRQAGAMANKQAMLMTAKNKSQIENARDSANHTKVIDQLLGATEQRLRNKGAEQEQYQNAYEDALVTKNVWHTFRTGLSAGQKALADIYSKNGAEALENYVGTDTTRLSDWNSLKQIMENEIIRQKASIKGVQIKVPTSGSQKNYFDPAENLFVAKKGGTIYKAVLSKRSKDNDRAAKSLESSRKIASRFLEKALDSLYTYKDVELIARPKNRRKYQAGGNLPFVGFTPVFATSEKGTPKLGKTTEDKETSKDLTNSDVLALLKDLDGLPSDMHAIVGALKNFTIDDSMDPLGLASSSNIASKYIKLIHQIKIAKFNRDEYNQAFDQLKGNGGLNELAITSEGLLVGENKEGDFDYFTVDDVRKGEHLEKGYNLLTNSNLLYLRANSVDAAFNHHLTTVAQNGIGIQTVNSLIEGVINNLGSMSDSQEGFVKTKAGDIIKGLKEFYKAIESAGRDFDGTVDDLYKYKYVTKDQKDQIQKAMTYIYQTLPVNAKTLLKVKSDGSDAGALKLIETLISSKEQTQAQVDIDLVGGKTHTKTAAASNKDTTDLKTSLPLSVLKGIGGVDSYLNVDRGDGIHMSVRGTVYNLIKTPSGESILNTSLLNMLAKSGLQGIITDIRGIQFGDQKLSPEALQYITYNNTGITRAILPINPDGSVRLSLLEEYNKAEAEVDLLENKSKENIRQIYESHNLLDLLNADGSYNMSKFAPFMVTEGYTTDALSGLTDSDFVKEFKGNSDGAVALMERSLALGSGNKTQVPDIDTKSWWNPGDWFGWTDKIYKGVVYIPITNNVNTAILGANQELDYEEAMSQEEKYQNFDKMANQRSTNADILNI